MPGAGLKDWRNPLGGPRVRRLTTSRRTDYGLVILASTIWGTSFPVIRVTVGEGGAVDPLLLTLLRLGLGALVGTAFLAATRRLGASIFRNRYVWILGALNAASFDLQHLGEVYTTASKTALLVNVNVVFVAILMVALYRERMTAGKALGVTLGVAGVAVLATRLDLGFLAGGELLGDVAVFLSGLLWSVYIITTKRMIDRGGDYIALTVGVLATTALFAAFVLPFADLSRPISATGWAGVLWLGLLTTFPPLVLWTKSLYAVSPTVSSVLLLNEVAVASLLSILFLGEPFALYFVAGGLLVLTGAWLASAGDRTATAGGRPKAA